MTDEKYIKDLEETLKKFLLPMKGLPYSVVIKAISGHEVLPFDKNNSDDKALLERLKEAMQNATQEAHKQGIKSKRRNEVGNYIERFVKSALCDSGMQANTPENSEGKRQSSGYPDIEIKDEDGRITYLECKTYNRDSLNSSLRSFYLQASENFKITHPARHLMVSFEIEEATRNNKAVFVPVSWQLYTLEELQLQLKHELNANNKDLYKESALLAKGTI